MNSKTKRQLNKMRNYLANYSAPARTIAKTCEPVDAAVVINMDFSQLELRVASQLAKAKE